MRPEMNSACSWFPQIFLVTTVSALGVVPLVCGLLALRSADNKPAFMLLAGAVLLLVVGLLVFALADVVWAEITAQLGAVLGVVLILIGFGKGRRSYVLPLWLPVVIVAMTVLGTQFTFHCQN
jgi:hypothetical protein